MKPARKPGRPPLDPTRRLSAPVSVRLVTSQYDALCRRAAADRCTVPALIRAALANFRHQE
jgi:hypothetical protein